MAAEFAADVVAAVIKVMREIKAYRNGDTPPAIPHGYADAAVLLIRIVTGRNEGLFVEGCDG